MVSVGRAISVSSLVFIAGWFLLSSVDTSADPAAPATRPAQAVPVSPPGAIGSVQTSRGPDVVARKLDAVIGDVDFRSTRFAEVLDFFRTKGQFAIAVNWDALAGVDVDQETRVTVQLRAVSLKAALGTVLTSIGSFESPLGYVIADGVVRISTEADLARITEVCVYNCEDLIQSPLTPDRRQVLESVIRERLVGAGHLSFEHALAVTMDELRRQAARDLIGLIETNVEPGTWQPEGTIGSASEFNGLIVIRHNAPAQAGVTQLLTMLRAAKGLRSDAKPAGGE